LKPPVELEQEAEAVSGTLLDAVVARRWEWMGAAALTRLPLPPPPPGR
jgi:hypothetical protein